MLQLLLSLLCTTEVVLIVPISSGKYRESLLSGLQLEAVVLFQI